jgi:hypothetical protein
VWGNNAVSALDFLKEKKEEEELVDNLTAPLSDLPRVDCAFAYGSGVFPQPDNNHTSPTKEVPMVDYILGVSSPVEWHSQVVLSFSFSEEHCNCCFFCSKSYADKYWNPLLILIFACDNVSHMDKPT